MAGEHREKLHREELGEERTRARGALVKGALVKGALGLVLAWGVCASAFGQQPAPAEQDGQAAPTAEGTPGALPALPQAAFDPLPEGLPHEGDVSGDGAAQLTNGAPNANDRTAEAGGDPPARVARLSVLEGEAASEPAGANSFAAAEVNQVVTGGDRLYTDAAGQAEIESGQIALRLGGGADLTVVALTDQMLQFGLAAGSAHLRSFALDKGTGLELDSPEAAITVLQPGDMRVDVDTANHTTTVDLVAGQVEVESAGATQTLVAGERVRLHGAQPDAGVEAFSESLPTGESDAVDSFSSDRDNSYTAGQQAASTYVNADTTGSADLAAYGSWDSTEGSEDGDGGPIWFPLVAVGWQPYSVGHWAFVRPWGWTWIAAERWGFAPFHYGRWRQVNGRWGWMPGPQILPPVYAPALVAFLNGKELGVTLGLASAGGVAAWFPLGAHEPYQPPYRASTLYLNRVNASNLATQNIAEAQTLYNQRAGSAYRAPGGGERRFSNRGGTVAVSAASFAAGRPVFASLLGLPGSALASVSVVTQPPAMHGLVAAGVSPARVVPPVRPRPVLRSPASVASQAHVPEDAGALLMHHQSGAVSGVVGSGRASGTGSVQAPRAGAAEGQGRPGPATNGTHTAGTHAGAPGNAGTPAGASSPGNTRH